MYTLPGRSRLSRRRPRGAHRHADAALATGSAPSGLQGDAVAILEDDHDTSPADAQPADCGRFGVAATQVLAGQGLRSHAWSVSAVVEARTP